MERILVALDGSDHSNKAVDLAADLAEKYGARLVLLHVLSNKPLSDAERHMAPSKARNPNRRNRKGRMRRKADPAEPLSATI